MTSFILFIIGILLNLFLVIIKKQLKFIAYIHIAYVWLIFTFSYDVVDYYNYFNGFSILKAGRMQISDTLEPGYYLLSKLISDMGYDYQVLRGIMFTIIVVLLIITAKKMRINPNYMCVVFSIYPLFIEMIQIRNAFAMAIVTFGICFFLFERKKKLYFLTVILASCFHISSIVYLVFVIDESIMQKKYSRKIFVSIIVALTVVFYVGGKKIPYLDTIVSLFDDSNRVNVWLSSSGNYGFIIYSILIFISIVITAIIKSNCGNKSFSKFMYRINLLSLVFIPLLMLASTFARLISNLCFVNYISWQENLNTDEKKRFGVVQLSQLVVTALVIIYLAIWVYLELSSEFDVRVLPFFENNYFLDMFRRTV